MKKKIEPQEGFCARLEGGMERLTCKAGKKRIEVSPEGSERTEGAGRPAGQGEASVAEG